MAARSEQIHCWVHGSFKIPCDYIQFQRILEIGIEVLCHKPTQKKLLTNFKLTLVKAIEISQNMEAAEKNLQQIKDPWSASSCEIITECAISNKQSTTSNLEVVTDMVTQIMQQRTTNLEKHSVPQVQKSRASCKWFPHKDRTRKKQKYYYWFVRREWRIDLPGEK